MNFVLNENVSKKLVKWLKNKGHHATTLHELNQLGINYFALLIEFYHALIRRLQNQLGTRIGGAAIAIRRMRPILWSLLNTDDECPSRVDIPIYRKSAKITYYMKPSELIDQEMRPIQDHVLILFDSIKNRRQQNK